MTEWTRREIVSWRGLSFLLIALGFWFWFAPRIGQAIIPPEWWLDVRTIIVADTVVGVSPAVVIDRDINRNFVGSYEATIRKVDASDGTIWTYCQPRIRPEITYRAGSPYPGRDLNWWLGSPPEDVCVMEPGKYLLRLDWTINALNGWLPLHVRRESAPFTVSEARQ